MAKIIEITIDQETAELKVEAHGFAGVGCKALVDGLAAALGKIETQFEKPEMKAVKMTTVGICR
jgi:hypothetical protein